MAKHEFVPDDLVSHKAWGIGRVRDIITDPEPSIIIDFPGRPNHRMSLRLAEQTLTRLPSDGLESLIAKDPAKVSQWSENAPLKLIAAVLTDIEGTGTPSQIREAVNGHGLLGNMKWESWWKTVQPEVMKSSHFIHLKSSRAYKLTTRVEDIPVGSVGPLPKKVRKSTIGREQVEEVVSELEAGRKTLQDIKGEKRFRSIIKKLVKRSKESEGAKHAITMALGGPVAPIRSIFKELSAQGRFSELTGYVVQLTLSIEGLVADQNKKGKNIVEHIRAKLSLLREISRVLAGQIHPDVESFDISEYARALINLALVLCHKDITGWRSDALSTISAIITTIGQKKVIVYEYVGKYLASLKDAEASRMIITETLLPIATAGTNTDAVDALLVGSLHTRSDYAQECVSRYIRLDQRLEWVKTHLARISNPFDSPAVDMLADILVAIPDSVIVGSLRDYLLTAIALGFLSPRAQAKLDAIIQSGLKSRLDIIWDETIAEGYNAQASDVLGSIELTTAAKGREQQQHHFDTYRRLDSQVANLRKSLTKSEDKSAALAEVTKQLQSSFRLPEQWAIYRGKKEVLESIALLYQEMLLAMDAGFETETTSRIGQRLLGILQSNGVVGFARKGDRVTYDPSQHELIPGSKMDVEDVVVRCPGFELRDPTNKRVILARTKVTA